MIDNLKNKPLLFLQGPNSFFFKKLADKLEKDGGKVTKINLCGGDKFFWNDDRCIDYSDKFENWRPFLKDLNRKNGFTDIFLYGDCRKYHQIAIEVFHNSKIHVFEEGYFRPYWVTHEIGGVNNFSPLPRTKDFYLNLDDSILEKNIDTHELKPCFRHKAFYTCINYIYRSFFDSREFPNYITHRDITPEEEGGAWLRKGFKSKYRKFKANRVEKIIFKRNKTENYYLFALQLCSDSQIREHSDFKGMRDAIRRVLEDFSKNCPKDIFLVIKTHPEEPGISKLEDCVKNISKELNIEKLVIFIDGGNMPNLIKGSLGMVTVNSTATLSAIHHEKPVICLGRSFYNFEGLTHQSGLKNFWKKPQSPKKEVFDKFRHYVHQNSQLSGNFYSTEGIEVLINNLITKL